MSTCGLLTIVSESFKYSGNVNSLISLVPGAGLEPARCCHRGILSPLRLPISPPGLRRAVAGRGAGHLDWTYWTDLKTGG